MSRIEACNFLQSRGWDIAGAVAIVLDLEVDGMLEDMTEDKLASISDDYADR